MSQHTQKIGSCFFNLRNGPIKVYSAKELSKPTLTLVQNSTYTINLPIDITAQNTVINNIVTDAVSFNNKVENLAQKLEACEKEHKELQKVFSLLSNTAVYEIKDLHKTLIHYKALQTLTNRLAIYEQKYDKIFKIIGDPRADVDKEDFNISKNGPKNKPKWKQDIREIMEDYREYPYVLGTTLTLFAVLIKGLYG